MLLKRVKTPLPRVLERMGGLQAQYAPSMYVGLWSRVEEFEREDLTRALERRSVVQGTLMRSTIHLVSKGDYWPFALGIRDRRREWWVSVGRREQTPRSMAAAARKLRAALAKRSPLHRSDVHDLLGRNSVLTNGVNMWLDLVRVPPSGTWERRRADLYALAEDWVGPENGTPAMGVELVVKRYLGGFGPSTREEIADWSGLRPTDLDGTLGALRLRRFQAEDGAELIDLPRAPLPDPETPAPVRFLGTWDAILLVHARRSGVLPEEHRSKVFSVKTPQSVPTFMVDGYVAGTWKYDRGRVRWQPFARGGASVRKAISEEADRLTDLHA